MVGVTFGLSVVLLAAEQSLLGPHPQYAGPLAYLGSNAALFRAADMNGDGRTDVVALHHGFPLATVASVHFGAGTGLFPDRLDHQTFYDFPSGLAVADVDLDGDLDVVVTVVDGGEQVHDLLVLTNDGTGGLAVGPAQSLEGLTPNGVELEDLNGDGFPDLLIPGQSPSALHVILNDGAGGFLPDRAVSYPAPNSVRAIVAGDFDGDSGSDVAGFAVLPGQVGVILLFKNMGDGTLTPAVEQLSGTTRPIAIASADINGDGNLDLALSHESGGSGDGFAGFFLNNGQGAFTITGQGEVALGFEPDSITFADVDGNGIPDLVSANNGSGGGQGDVSLVRGLGGGAFVPEQRLSSGPNPIGILAAELNSDQLEDLLVLCGNNEAIQSRLNVGPPRYFRDPVRVDLAINAQDLVVGNFNADAAPDVAVLDPFADRLISLSNAGNGTFEIASDVLISDSSGDPVVGDLNGDGFDDLAAFSALADTLSILLADGSGGHIAQPPIDIEGNPSDMTLADVSGDLHPDLVFCNVGTDDLTVLVNDGAGGFTPLSSPLPLGNPFIVTSGDVDSDGDIDLAVAFPDDTVRLLVNDGEGGFGDGQTFELADAASDIAIADVNADGWRDVLVVIGSDDLVAVYLSLGGMRFAPPASYPIETQTETMSLGDVDADGAKDIVVASDQRYVQVLLNDGEGAFGKNTGYGVGGDRLALADTDLDGRLDIVVASGDLFVLDHLDTPGPVDADLNADGVIDSLDLNILLRDFGCVGGGCVGDVDGDGDTDHTDLDLLVCLFGSGLAGVAGG